jgi:hypothetical protein
VTISVVAFKSRDGRLYETEREAHAADEAHRLAKKRDELYQLLLGGRWGSGHIDKDAFYVLNRVEQNWDALKKLMES